MPLLLTEISTKPSRFTWKIELRNGDYVLLRPLEKNDAQKLAIFLSNLSKETRRKSVFDGYDLKAAKQLCDSIAKYDKLRFVVDLIPASTIIGLVEFSFDITLADIERYGRNAIKLRNKTDLRFGPTFADNYQNKGLGSLIFPAVIEIAKKFDKQRIILWGGVLKNNERAIHFYIKHGFKITGEHKNKDEQIVLDMIFRVD